MKSMLHIRHNLVVHHKHGMPWALIPLPSMQEEKLMSMKKITEKYSLLGLQNKF